MNFPNKFIKAIVYAIATIVFVCLLGGGIIPGLIYQHYISTREKREKLEKEKIIAREKYVSDSLSKDPLYQDSLRKQREKQKREIAIEDSIYRTRRLVIISYKDSIKLYHDATFCREINLLKIPYEVVTIANAEAKGFSLCPNCMDCETIYDQYTSGDLIDREEHEEQIAEIEEMYQAIIRSYSLDDYYDE